MHLKSNIQRQLITSDFWLILQASEFGRSPGHRPAAPPPYLKNEALARLQVKGRGRVWPSPHEGTVAATLQPTQGGSSFSSSSLNKPRSVCCHVSQIYFHKSGRLAAGRPLNIKQTVESKINPEWGFICNGKASPQLQNRRGNSCIREALSNNL